jgi:MraZ protein
LALNGGKQEKQMLFLSTYQNKIDKKGRVSVPAGFRVALTKMISSTEEFSGIIAYASFINRCIEACGIERIRKLSGRIESLDPFSEERDAFATTILGGSMQLAFDGEGRVMLPESLIDLAGLHDTAVFIGKGETFEIWEPGAFTEYAARARELAREKRSRLRSEGNVL